MRKVLGRIALALILLAATTVFIGFIGLRLVQRNIVSKMQPPRLQLRREASSDLIYWTLNGQQRHVRSTEGKVVFLDLWGTWCVQCVAEMPTVQKLYDRYKNDPQVEFLIVSRLDSPSSVRSYAMRNHMDLSFYVTEDEDIPPDMQLNQFPSTFLFAKDGSLAAKHVGAADWSASSVSTFIEQLKAQ